MEERIRFQNITKRFGKTLANNDINLTIMANEVHCLLGENGSGKTTLMNVLFGIHHPDKGEIFIDGKLASIHSPKDAHQYGVGMVHQHFMLFNQNTVLENIIIGEERTKLFLALERQRIELQALIDRFGFQLNLDDKVCNLSVGAKQRVEILKILYRGMRIIIFDEPTAVLTPQESEQLMAIIEQLKKEGKTIIYISHKLNETLRIGDRISVLRKGQLVKTMNCADATPDMLAVEMVGKSLSTSYTRGNAPAGAPLLECRSLQLRPGYKPCDFTVHSGEIVGIAGVDGNGQLELEQLIMGLVPVSGGCIRFDGKDITNTSTLERRLGGIGYIPADRFRYAILPDESVEENYFLGNFSRPEFQKHGIIQKKHLATYAAKITKEYDVRTSSPHLPIRSLSGGNQQKAVLARELSQNPKLILAAHPTRGLDIGAITYIHHLILKKRDEGCGILLISAELSELQAVCDRLLVLFNGEVVAEGPVTAFTQQQLGLYMAGHLKECMEVPDER